MANPPSTLGDGLVELRAFGTSFIAIWTAHEPMLSVLAKRFGVVVEALR